MTFIEAINKSIIYKFSKEHLSQKRTLARRLYLTVDKSLFLNTWTTNITFQFLCIEVFY